MPQQYWDAEITVFHRVCKVKIRQTDKGKWRISGHYGNEYIESKLSRTFESAIEDWRAKAELRADS